MSDDQYMFNTVLPFPQSHSTPVGWYTTANAVSGKTPCATARSAVNPWHQCKRKYFIASSNATVVAITGIASDVASTSKCQKNSSPNAFDSHQSSSPQMH